MPASDPAAPGLSADELAALAPWVRTLGRVALVGLRTSGPGGRGTSFAGSVRELAVLVLEPDDAPTLGFSSGSFAAMSATTAPALGARVLVFAGGRRGKLSPSSLASARTALARTSLFALGAEELRGLLAREVDPTLATREIFDAGLCFGLLHPDARELDVGSPASGFAQESAAADVVALARRLAAEARAAQRQAPRHAEVAQILAERWPDSPWRALVDPNVPAASPLSVRAAGPTTFAEFVARASATSAGSLVGAAGPASPASGAARYLVIGESQEEPVPFDAGAIAAALGDVERGRRHFPGYRVRKEQIELARQFFHVLTDGGVAKLEGGTGVGKSLAYLAAVIPFARARAEAGERGPVVLSTRTKLLQDQLLEKDIAAAARFLGHPELRALSIKGRANYVCERRLGAMLADGGDPQLRRDWQADFALLEACARLRPAGEVGTVPRALLSLRPRLRELLRGSVAARSDQCSREQCGHEKRCPFGLHRRALARAELVVANHDLLLRWPPDYPAFSHVVADEGHELGGVAEEVYAIRVRPEEIEERLDALFGRPARRGASRHGTRGLVAAAATRSEEAVLDRNRNDLRLELAGLGHQMAAFADAFGGSELPADAGRARPGAARLAQSAAARLDALAQHALREGPERRFERGESSEGKPIEGLRDLAAEEEAQRAIQAHAEALGAAANGLRLAFAVDDDAWVGAFESLETPFDRWSLVLRPVDPGPAFREEFLARVESLAVVSATLFVGGDDHAALGEIGLAGESAPSHFRYSVPSPFPYAEAMRVVALDAGSELVEDMAQALALVARRLRGRTLGLFTSLARMREVAARLGELVSGEGLEILAPLRAGDDPGGLVERFRSLRGEAVMLGARRYWQGIDVRGDDLQAVVIEKLPFEVPTELRRRRDERLRASGVDPFERAALGHMLLHLKQMVGRLIRSETDRGLVVLVDARPDRRYFRRLGDALPDGVAVERVELGELHEIIEALGLGGAG